MARKRRIFFPSATYHVMLKGNNGQPIFFSPDDKYRMCFLIQEGVERFGHRIHSYCFMKNHIHLALQIGEVSLSRIIQNLAFRYSRYINHKQGTVGHLFQGRFKSIIVDSEQYLIKLIRYIHLNPVRAGIVVNPENYQWSSHRAYLQKENLAWLTCDYVLEKFGNESVGAVKNFSHYVNEGIGMKAEQTFETGCREGILGDDNFVEKILDKVGYIEKRKIPLTRLVQEFCRRYNVSEKELCVQGKSRPLSHMRSLLAYLVKETDNISLEKLARFLNRSPSGLSKLACRLEKKSLESENLNAEIQDLKNWLTELQMSECQA